MKIVKFVTLQHPWPYERAKICTKKSKIFKNRLLYTYTSKEKTKYIVMVFMKPPYKFVENRTGPIRPYSENVSNVRKFSSLLPYIFENN